MSRVINQNPPENLMIQCPLINFRHQMACMCATLDDGNRCPNYGGLLDNGEDMVNAALQHDSSVDPVQLLMKIPEEDRYRIVCGHPTPRRLERIFGMGGK